MIKPTRVVLPRRPSIWELDSPLRSVAPVASSPSAASAQPHSPWTLLSRFLQAGKYPGNVDGVSWAGAAGQGRGRATVNSGEAERRLGGNRTVRWELRSPSFVGHSIRQARQHYSWTEDRIPRWTFYWMLWALTKGAETSEVTETFLEARLDPGLAGLMILEKPMAASRDPLPQKAALWHCRFSHRVVSLHTA